MDVLGHFDLIGLIKGYFSLFSLGGAQHSVWGWWTIILSQKKNHHEILASGFYNIVDKSKGTDLKLENQIPFFKFLPSSIGAAVCIHRACQENGGEKRKEKNEN